MDIDIPAKRFIKKIVIEKITSLANSEVTDILEIQQSGNLSSWSKTDYIEESQKSDAVFLLARNEKRKILGFLVARLIGHSTFEGTVKNFEQADLLNFGVLPNERRKGIGGKLFKKFAGILQALEVSEVWLEVRESNREGLAFYQKRGFSKTQTRKNFYTDPCENAFVLKLEIERLSEIKT